MSVLFSVTIDLTAVLFGFLAGWAPPYPARLAVFVLGCAVLALGVFLIVSGGLCGAARRGVRQRRRPPYGPAVRHGEGALRRRHGGGDGGPVSLLCFRQVRGIREGP